MHWGPGWPDGDMSGWLGTLSKESVISGWGYLLGTQVSGLGTLLKYLGVWLGTSQGAPYIHVKMSLWGPSYLAGDNSWGPRESEGNNSRKKKRPKYLRGTSSPEGDTSPRMQVGTPLCSPWTCPHLPPVDMSPLEHQCTEKGQPRNEAQSTPPLGDPGFHLGSPPPGESGVQVGSHLSFGTQVVAVPTAVPMGATKLLPSLWCHHEVPKLPELGKPQTSPSITS